MHKLISRRAALVVSAGAVVFTGTAALPAQAAGVPGWRPSLTIPVRSGEALLTTVNAVSARDAWSAGFRINTAGTTITAVIRHWNGTSWRAVALPSAVARTWTNDEVLQDVVGASSPSNVWISGASANGVGAYLRLNGTHWSAGRLPGVSLATGKLVEIDAIKVFSRLNVWAFGEKVDVSGTTPTIAPYAAHFNGTKWTVTSVPGNSAITSVSAPSSTGIWAVAGTLPEQISPVSGAPGQQAVLHWTPGGGWQQPAQPVLPAGSHLTSVVVQSGKVIVGGSRPNSLKGRTPLTVTWNGTAWSAPSAGPTSTAKWEVASLAPDGRGGTWALGLATNRTSAKLWHLSGGKWTVATPAFGPHAWILFQLSTVPRTDSVWGAGALREGTSAVGLIALAGPKP